MIDDLVRDFQVLRKTDALIARIWLNLGARRFGMFVFAGLIAVFGLAMTNVAGYYTLQTKTGEVGAAAAMAVLDFLIAGVIMLVASKSRPGPELEVAYEVRKMAVDSMARDAQKIKLALDGLGRELRDVRASVTTLMNNPLDVAAQKLLIPAALSIMRNIRAKKTHS